MRVPKARGRSIVHDFKNLPPALTPEALEQAVESHDVDALIHGHMRLALQVIAIYGQSDDLIGAGMFGLVYAVNRWPEVRRDNNISPYIVTIIHSKIRDHLDNDDVVRMPGRTRRLKKADRVKVVHDIDVACKNGDDRIHFREMMSLVVKTPLEKRIVELRMEGHGDVEIAYRLGYTQPHIGNIRNQLKKRFLDLQ